MKRLVSLLGAVYLMLQIGVGLLLHPLPGPQLLAMQTDPRVVGVAGWFARWEHTGVLGSFERHFLLDDWLPLAYGALLVAALVAVDFRPSRRWRIILPMVAAAGDLVENGCDRAALAMWRAGGVDAIAPTMVAVGAVASWVKWALVLVSIVLVLRARRGAIPSPVPTTTVAG